MTSIPTRRIRFIADEREGLINVSDFDPAVHEDLEEITRRQDLEASKPDAVKAKIEAITAADELDALEADETAGKARKSVLAAIAARREALKGS